MNAKKTTVIHSSPVWLPRTQSWLYDLVRSLPSSIDNHVFCERTQLMDEFRLSNLHVASERPALVHNLDRVMRRFGARRHLNYAVTTGRAVGVEVWHSHFGTVGWVDLDAVRRIGAKHVVSFYGFDAGALPQRDPSWRERYQEMFAQVDRVMCEGKFMGQTIVALGCPEEKVIVHRLGVDVDSIPFQPRRWRSGDKLRVLMAAAFREKKGFPYGIEALGRIKDANIELTIIGDVDDNDRSREERRKIEEALDRSNMRAKTRMPGFTTLDTMRQEAREHDLFMAPSVHASDGDSEGGAPVTLIEMAASGMPIVSTKHCDIPGVVVDGETGALADERDIGGLAERVEWWLSDPDAWGERLAAGRQRMETRFNARLQGEALAKFYSRLTSA